jgi:hypothetical protein
LKCLLLFAELYVYAVFIYLDETHKAAKLNKEKKKVKEEEKKSIHKFHFVISYLTYERGDQEAVCDPVDTHLTDGCALT